MTPNFLLCHIPQAVKSMSEEMKVCVGGAKRTRGRGGGVLRRAAEKET